MRQTSLIGPESWVAERVAAFAEAGVTVLTAQPLDDSPAGRRRTIETLARIAR